MRIRHVSATDQKIQLQMTPMIDIVFQLLVFFVMSFKIGAQEGDFNIRMPLASRQAGLPDESPLLSMHVRLLADPAGHLLPANGIVVNNEVRFDSFEELHNYIIGVVGGDEPAARADAEVELDCDYSLHYEHVVEAITAVSGYVERSTGRVQKLIEKIKFAPPEEAPQS